MRSWVGIAGSLVSIALLWSSSASAQRISTGTGFVVHGAGWVVTNEHVVDGCDRLQLADGRAARMIASDPDIDLAVLKMDGSDHPYLPLRSVPARLTEDVVALGFPLSDVLSGGIRATTGTVSATDGIAGDARYLQTSAPIQPGNSGGPLLDRAGAVLGVMVATLSDDVYAQAQNVNFAIKAPEAIRFLERNGIAHEVSRILPPPDGPTLSDRMENISRAVVLIECLAAAPRQDAASRPDARSAPAPSASPPPGDGLVAADGYDIVGFDYMRVEDVSYLQCRVECSRTRRCQAFTYNTRYGVCFLKHDTSLLLRNADARSAYRMGSNVMRTDFTVSANRDSPGGDYRRIREIDFIACFAECALDTRCRAFAYVRRLGDCWLKDRVTAIRAQDGVELGIK